ncbi:MAG: hypothetical protein HYT77_04725 [Deltaproteobacteria bacterium]|nr:hypothetical protein [Deltaproteobacteria bacterium]
MIKRGALWAFLFILSACAEDQVSGVSEYVFQSTVCVTNSQPIPFVNDTEEEMVIEGVAVAAGTDPYGNFSLQDVVVADTSLSAEGASFSNIRIPAGEEYQFQVSYTPKTSGGHSAVIDVVYRAPLTGVRQLHLTGTADGTGPVGCIVADEGAQVDISGEAAFTITKLVAATSKISQPLSSEDGVRPLDPVSIEMTLDATAGTAMMEQIKEGSFILPRPRENVEILGGNILQDTMLSTSGDARGTYDDSKGSLKIDNLVVTLNGDFNTTITTTLTTDEVSLKTLSTPLVAEAIASFGSRHYDSVGKRIFGKRIDPLTGAVVLVGTTTIQSSTLDPGANSMFDDMSGTTMAILIEGTIVKKGSDSTP